MNYSQLSHLPENRSECNGTKELAVSLAQIPQSHNQIGKPPALPGDSRSLTVPGNLVRLGWRLLRSPSPRPLPKGEGEPLGSSGRAECAKAIGRVGDGRASVAPSFGAWDRSRHSPNLDETFACSPSPRGRGRGEGEGFVRFSIASSILQIALIPHYSAYESFFESFLFIVHCCLFIVQSSPLISELTQTQTPGRRNKRFFAIFGGIRAI